MPRPTTRAGSTPAVALDSQVPVPLATCQEIIDVEGVPLYLKADIEGRDTDCVFSLRPAPPCELPLYVSLEYRGGVSESAVDLSPADVIVLM